MSLPRRPIGSTFGNDPFVRGLGYMMWGAPVAIALALSWQLLAQGPATPAPAINIRAAVATIEKPIMTQAVLRPRREAASHAAIETSSSREQLVAMAFMPRVDVIVDRPGPKPDRRAEKELTTASTQPPRPRLALSANRPWRMETLRGVGVADGLRLISGGAMLALAGVEPLDHDAKCKRLDGVQEACSTRAASRLEVLTRGRTVTCRVYEGEQGQPVVASCRADKIDLADDLVKNGLARRAQA